MAKQSDTPIEESTETQDSAEAPEEKSIMDFAEDTQGADSGIDDGAGAAGGRPESDTPTVDDALEDTLEPGGASDDRDILTEYGLDKYHTIEDALRGAAEAQKLVGQRDEYSEIGRQLAPHYGQIQEMLAQQQKADQPQSAWAPPVEQTSDMQQLDAAVKAAQSNPEALAAIRGQVSDELWGQYEQLAHYRRSKWDQWFSDPHSLVDELIAPRMAHYIEERFSQQNREQIADSFVGEVQSDTTFTDPQAVQMLDQLLAMNTPHRVALNFVRMAMQQGKADNREGRVAKREANLNRKRNQLRSRASRRGQRAAKPDLEMDVENMNYDDIRSKVLAMDEAGALD